MRRPVDRGRRVYLQALRVDAPASGGSSATTAIAFDFGKLYAR